MLVSALPPLAPDVRATVAIPARNEAQTLPHALAALDAQIDLEGRPLDPRSYDIVVLANGCSDETASIARAHARSRQGPAITVIEIDFAPQDAHVGVARRTLLGALARRALRAGRPRAILASTDADSTVAQAWLGATIDEMTNADAVMGRISVARADLATLHPRARTLYLRDAAHRRLVGELEAMRDPVAHDPLPRHGQHYGASLAVTAEAYMRAGGCPPLPALEDLAFFEALERIDARVRHSMRVRVATSARRYARVDGGFATFLTDLGARGTLHVESPVRTIVRLDARAVLRRLWRGDPRASDASAACRAYACTAREFHDRFDRGDPFGANVERFEAHANEAWARYVPVAVERALPIVRALRASANAVSPIRRAIASGAG